MNQQRGVVKMVDRPKKPISIVIVYNNAEKLEEATSWIDKQSLTADIQVVALDNRDNRYPSAAKALNDGASRAEGDFLVFMHQDVYLWDLYAVQKIRDYLTEHPTDIAGAAGQRRGWKTISDIYETREGQRYHIRTNGKNVEVATLDECLFSMTKVRWSELRFDEVCCDNWHCYAVDICLNNTLNGGRNVVLPLDVCHESRGNPYTDGFRNAVGKLVRKYRRTELKYITSTCVDIACCRRGYAAYRARECVHDILDKLGLLRMKRHVRDTLDKLGLLKYWHLLFRRGQKMIE